HPSAQQSRAPAISAARAEAGAAGNRRMVSSLGDRRLHRARSNDPAWTVLLRLQRYARRHLSGASDVQRAAPKDTARRVSKTRRSRRRAAQAASFRQGAAGKSARRRVTYAVAPVKSACLQLHRSTNVTQHHIGRVVFWMLGALISFSVSALAIRALGKQL